MEKFIIEIATENHLHFALVISKAIEDSASQRVVGIAKRSPEYIADKIKQSKAVIATTSSGQFAGFCYIETFSNDKYVSNSGLIVAPEYRQSGLAKEIKKKIFEFSSKKYPHAKIFGLTTSLAVMKINSDLGYKPVTFSELTKDYQFWKGCESCSNYSILVSKQWENCLCTAMINDAATNNKNKKDKNNNFLKKIKIYERLLRLKQYKFLKNGYKLNKSEKIKTNN